MTSTQKRWVEWPLILILIAFVQALELSVFQKIPFFFGAIHLVPVVITYVALTRDWLKSVGIVTLFAALGSATIGFPVGFFVGAQVWTALLTKVLVSVLALEGRRIFCVLVMGGQIVSKILVIFMLSSKGRVPEMLHFWGVSLTSALAMGLLAWFIYPLLLWWDRYFEHIEEDMPELNPRFH
jgi:hypothetical protein